MHPSVWEGSLSHLSRRWELIERDPYRRIEDQAEAIVV